MERSIESRYGKGVVQKRRQGGGRKRGRAEGLCGNKRSKRKKRRQGARKGRSWKVLDTGTRKRRGRKLKRRMRTVPLEYSVKTSYLLKSEMSWRSAEARTTEARASEEGGG